jgi:hypothetical protein
MISVAALAFVLSLVLTLAARRLLRPRSARYPQDAPQRFHVGDVPRVGGIGLLAGATLALAALPLLQAADLAGNIDVDRVSWVTWALVVLPAFAGGVLEDLTQKLAVRWRLLLTLSSGLLAWGLFGIAVPRLDFAWLDAVWNAWPWLGVGLAVLAVAGLPHAFNIIDGYNGLAGVVALVVCLALAHVALQVGDRELAVLAVALAAATGVSGVELSAWTGVCGRRRCLCVGRGNCRDQPAAGAAPSHRVTLVSAAAADLPGVGDAVFHLPQADARRLAGHGRRPAPAPAHLPARGAQRAGRG